MSSYRTVYNKKTRTTITPMFCPVCSSLRKEKNSTILSAFEDVQYQMTGMCTLCYAFLQDKENESIVNEWEKTLEKE